MRNAKPGNHLNFQEYQNDPTYILKSIRMKDNINYHNVFSTYIRETRLACKLNLVSKDSRAYLPTPFALCVFSLI